MPDEPKATIAIVEDEFIVALDIKNVIQKNGYRTVGIFPSGEELLDKFEALTPDLVLMDIRIKGAIDGVETARLVHERYGTPVILLTAYADEETVSRAKLTQPFGYIIKPFEERELRTSIEIALYRAAMEKRLRESEERYRRLFSEGISGNFLADTDGRLLEANYAFKSLLKINSTSPLPHLRDLFPDATAWESFRTGLDASGRLEAAELLLAPSVPVRRDSKYKTPHMPELNELHVIANIRLVPRTEHQEGRIQGELFDATERRRLESRLGQSQKMEAIGKLAGGIAHDFNNILTAIMGYANLLAEDSTGIPQIHDDIDGIKNAAAKAANLTRQLLAFSRRQTASPVVLDLDVVVQDMERMLRRLITEEISLSLALDSSSRRVYADPSQLEQVLVNLIVNARDAMPCGGRISISTRVETLSSSRAVGLDTLAPGEYLLLSVRDSGEGISPEILGLIFEPFFTTKPKDQGTGLGLSTVYGIVKQAGGAVDVESKKGHGAAFIVWLPAVLPPASTPLQKSVLAVPERQRVGTILFVDDDETVRVLSARFLGKRGYSVLLAANAGEALLIAESYGKTIDLLVSDLVMPLMDGGRLAKRLSEMLPGLKVLFISGYPDRTADSSCKSSFLAKPFTEAELSRAVDAAMAI